MAAKKLPYGFSINKKTANYLLFLAFFVCGTKIQNNCLGKRHISILFTRNVIWTLGGGGVGACDVSR